MSLVDPKPPAFVIPSEVEESLTVRSDQEMFESPASYYFVTAASVDMTKTLDEIRNFIDGQFVGTEAAARAILDLIASKA